jgi:transposase
LAPEIEARIVRAEDRLAVIAAQLAVLTTAEQRAAQTAAADSALGRLVRLKGIAATGAQVLLEEGLVWRAFRNRREIGGMLGFAPLPYQSGDQARDQGIDRAGNRRWRAISPQLAWNWVQWQRTSALTQGYQRRFGGGGARLRRIGIVALARKLVIALWRTATTGELPAGAVLKVA